MLNQRLAPQLFFDLSFEVGGGQQEGIAAAALARTQHEGEAAPGSEAVGSSALSQLLALKSDDVEAGSGELLAAAAAAGASAPKQQITTTSLAQLLDLDAANTDVLATATSDIIAGRAAIQEMTAEHEGPGAQAPAPPRSSLAVLISDTTGTGPHEWAHSNIDKLLSASPPEEPAAGGWPAGVLTDSNEQKEEKGRGLDAELGRRALQELMSATELQQLSFDSGPTHGAALRRSRLSQLCGCDDGESLDLARNHAGQPCAVDRLHQERLDAEEARKAYATQPAWRAVTAWQGAETHGPGATVGGVDEAAGRRSGAPVIAPGLVGAGDAGEGGLPWQAGPDVMALIGAAQGAPSPRTLGDLIDRALAQVHQQAVKLEDARCDASDSGRPPSG